MSKIPGPFWLPWVVGIVVVGVVGGTLGLTGVFGHPTVTKSVLLSDARLDRTATAYSCPGGSEVTKLQAHDRVLAVARSDDSGFLGVRDPLNLGRTVWVRSGDIAVDKSQAAIATLPVSSCPVVSILMPPTSQSGGTTTTPTKPSAPSKPAPDTTAPTLGIPTAATPIVCNKAGSPPYTDTISVTASDNVGVSSVAISWTGATTGNDSMTRSGGSWSYVYSAANSLAGGTITFQVQARDAAGNLSAPQKVSITQGGCVG